MAFRVLVRFAGLAPCGGTRKITAFPTSQGLLLGHRSAIPSVMARVNLTLDPASYDKLAKYAKASGAPRAAAARRLLCEALEYREERARRARLAADYAADRSDARELLNDLEAPELELLGDEEG